jgi:hypothetical protein
MFICLLRWLAGVLFESELNKFPIFSRFFNTNHYEIIVKILTKLTKKRQNIHIMGRFSLLCGRGLLKISINRLDRINGLEMDPYKRIVCRSLFNKIKIASDRIDKMKRSKDQKLSTLNLLALRTNALYKFFQSHFPGPYRLF